VFFPGLENLYQQFGVMPSSGTGDDAAYQEWASAMRQYADATNSNGLPAVRFWLILRVHKTDFSDKVEMHETIPMLLPKVGCGELVGVASDKPELDRLITPNENNSIDSRRDYIYLTYKVKIQGQDAWRTFLEFVGTHNMLEQDG
jgi:hypothetical protein